MTPTTIDQKAAAPVILQDHFELAATIVSDVFSTMLQTEATPSADTSAGVPFPVTGAVYFTGGFMGAAVIEVGYELAFHATAALMGVPPPTEVDSDVRDSIGELANMIAGNLKAILPSEAMLSMPSVVEGRDFALSVIGGNTSSRLTFISPYGPIVVTLVQMRPHHRS